MKSSHPASPTCRQQRRNVRSSPVEWQFAGKQEEESLQEHSSLLVSWMDEWKNGCING